MSSQDERQIEVVVYTKKDCCLCEQAKEIVKGVARSYPIKIKEVDITHDEKIYAKYSSLIPVIFVDGHLSFIYNVAEADLRKKLDSVLAPRR